MQGWYYYLCFRIEVLIDANNAIEATTEELDEDEDIEVSHIHLFTIEYSSVIAIFLAFIYSHS